MGYLNPKKVDNTELLKSGLVIGVLSDSNSGIYTDTFNMSNQTSYITLFHTENKVFGKSGGYVLYGGANLTLEDYAPTTSSQGVPSTTAPYLEKLVKSQASVPIDENVKIANTKITFDLPDGITSNYQSGDKLPANFQILFKGDMKEGDKITITRSGKGDAILTIPNDCNFAGLMYTYDNYSEIKVKYGNGASQPATQNMPIKATYNLTHCTSNITDSKLSKKKYDFVITADSGYKFSGSATYYCDYDNGNEYDTEIKYSENSTKISFTADLTNVSSMFILKVSAIQTVPDTHNTPTEFTHIYTPSETDLRNLTTDIITYFDNDGAMNVLDIGAYITNLYHVPYPVPDKLIGDSNAIILASKKSSVSSPTVLGNNFAVDLGTISVTEKYNSNFDYSNTQCFLVCPYTDRIGLQIDDVIEHTLKLKFVINIYNGDCTLLVASDEKLIYKSTFKIANKIPYIQNYVDNSNKNNTDNIIYNDIATAYVEIIRPKPLNNTIVSTEEVGKVKDYKGFVAIDDVSLNTNASYQEQQEIENKLQAGVYINE